MKRTILSLVLVVSLGAAVQSGVATGSSTPTSITLHARSQVVHARYVDNPPAGPSAGDDLVFTERIMDPSGRTIGSDAASCIRLFDQRLLCTGVYILPHGQIMVQLVQPGPTGVYDQAITGGTGGYARATGTVRPDQHPGGDRFTFHIHLPSPR